jgi:hypothetical protein
LNIHSSARRPGAPASDDVLAVSDFVSKSLAHHTVLTSPSIGPAASTGPQIGKQSTPQNAMALVTVLIVPLPFGAPIRNSDHSCFLVKDKCRTPEDKDVRSTLRPRTGVKTRCNYEGGTHQSES